MCIIVYYDKPVVVNHGVLCCASGCESCCVILSRVVVNHVYYAEPVVVNHSELC